MMNTSQMIPRPARLNPIAFPSDTDVRFVLLIVTVLGASLFIYNWIGLQMHLQELLAAVSCTLHQTPNLKQTLLAQNVSAFQTAAIAVRQCGIPYHRIETAYMLGGVVLLIAVAVVIYWLFPLWNLWRGKLVPLSAEDSPELMTYLAELCREAQLARPPSFVCNPFNQTITGLAFGRIERYYVALSGGLVTLFFTDRARFRAIVLHELAHLCNADVTKTYFAIACWWAFVIVAFVPFVVISAVGFVQNPNILLTLDKAWRVLVMAVLVFLVLAATLRAREFYADVRAAIWENSSGPLLRVLNLLEKPKNHWQKLIHVHPDPSERGRTLNETDRLFHMGLWDAFGFGIAIGIAAPNVLVLVSSLLNLLPQIAFSDILDWQTFGAALLLAPLLAVTAGLSIWRTTFAALVQGRVPLGIGRASLFLGVGLFLGTFLSLSFDNILVNPLFLFVLSIPWGLGVLVSLFLFLRWIATGTSAWLDVMISSRSPRPFYTVGLVITSGVLVVVLAQLFLFHSLATTIAPLLNTPFDLLIDFPIVIVGSILLVIYDTLLSPGVLVAFICLWAFPLAAWFWRKQVTTPVGSHWAFLDASSQPVVVPRQDPYRLRFALIVGLVGGLIFCGLLLMIRIVVHLSIPETTRSTRQFLMFFFYGTLVLAALLQAGIAGTVAGQVKRLGVLHGLFAAFVGGCVMTVGILGLNLLYGGTAPAAFIWITFSFVINGGTVLALPVAFSVSTSIDRRIREALLEIAIRDLEARKSFADIAEAWRRLDELFPSEAKLPNLQWATLVTQLHDASQDATRYRSPLGRRSRLEALGDMIKHLRGVYPNVVVRDARLSDRLGKVVNAWLMLAQQEQEKLQQVPDYIGRIDNPYNPGGALKPDDPRFTGRLDLVQRLEMELMKGSSRPTFLMIGERRMGKSSTLLQMPRFLGSRFLPIFYDLQSPGIFASTPTFLGVLANGIYEKMTASNLSVERLVYRSTREVGELPLESQVYSSSRNIPSALAAYHIFDGWLRSVEFLLEREDRTLLLLLDEFEKLGEARQKRFLDLPLLLDWFRNIIQYHPRVALLFSGIRTFGEMSQETGINWAGYFVNVQVLPVSFLHEDEARRLITRPLPDFTSEDIYGAGVVDDIIRDTGCHPFLVQAVCSALINNLNAEKKERAEVKDVKKAIQQAFNNWWDTYFRDLWYRTDEHQRACLLALRALAVADREHIQRQSGLDEIVVRRTLQTLLKRDLVRHNEDDTYCISTPIFSEWVERGMYS